MGLIGGTGGGKATCGEAVLSGWAAQSVNIDCGTR